MRYIDHNPVKAGLAAEPWGYPWGSAARYVHCTRERWLEREWIRSEVEAASTPGLAFGEAYKAFFPAGLGDAARRWVETRIEQHHDGPDDLDELVLGAPARAQDWMRRKTKLADGGTLGLAMADLETVAAAVQGEAEALDALNAEQTGRSVDRRFVLMVGAARCLSSATWSQIARLTEHSESFCARVFALHHARWMEENGRYRDAAERVARAAVRGTVLA